MPIASPQLPGRAGHQAAWPLVYRPPLARRIGFGALGVAVALGGLALAGYDVLHPPRGGGPVLALVGLAFALLGGYLVAAVLLGRILLHEQKIEVVEFLRAPRDLRRDELTGLRIVPLQYGLEQLVLELRGLDRKPFKTTLPCARDAAFDAWFAGVPDLEARERQQAVAELLASPALGRDEGERRGALERARRVAWALRAAAFAAAAWGWFLPRPYPAAVAVLATLPLAGIGLALAGRGRYSLWGGRTDPRPELLTPILIPGLVLGLRALLDVHLVGGRALIPWVALGALGLAAALRAADVELRKRWWTWLVVAPLVAFYPWGALVEANSLLDRSPGERFEVRVTAKRIERGKVTRHELRLAPWGPVDEPEGVDVTRAIYQAVEVGGTVCTELYDGALGVRWFDVDRCP